ncbi:Response regulator receiver domain protein [Planctomycetes bacterium CA13]|uniref:Response regulator receiver domain protein n=1 Tax=Novipirellula herctigrandis TaxID=2527986 RepID=A0A5C5Z9A1_9BACT|nr:Response regulator receiver domain protein [Planctomycetes bacterium CA13]
MDRTVQHDAHAPQSAHTTLSSPSKKQASIVVVDASPLSLIATAGVLHYQGYKCMCSRSAECTTQALAAETQDLIVWDVGDDAAAVLDSIAEIRQNEVFQEIPVVLLADSQWAGLEKKAEQLSAPTRCLFKPIDPNSLIAVVDQLLWMPSLVSAHRKRGSKPSRPGWVTL